MNTLHLDLPIALSALEAVQAAIEAHLTAAGASTAAALRVRLVVEELLANLVMHGRFVADPPPPARVSVEVRPDGIAISIEDAAAPFDPRTAVPRPAHDPSDPPLGGLGLVMVRRSAEIRAYGVAAAGWNRTDLWISLGSKAA